MKTPRSDGEATRRIGLLENQQTDEQWTTLQLLEPIKGFEGENAILYRSVHGDLDPTQRAGILLYLMAKTDNPDTRHLLLIEYLDGIPDELKNPRAAKLLGPLHADYVAGKLNITECLDAVCDNRERWINECASENS